jgi:DNA polymerase-3 subunit delta'
MLLKDIKGQEAAVSFLKSSLKKDRLSHAYIFCGPRGVGKFTAASAFAAEIALSGDTAHPDILVLKPEKEGAAIKIDDVRRLIKDIYLKPFQARKKVYIMDEAQSMKHEAANALLKTLEEPPTDSVLILVTDDLKALFHTIVSRSQVVRFYPLKVSQIEESLVKDRSLDREKARVLSRLACGSLGKAILYAEEDVFDERNSLIDIVSTGRADALSLDETPKERLKLYLDILLVWFRDILSVKALADDSMIVNADKMDLIRSQAGRMSFERLEGIINDILRTLSYLDMNANTKLAMGVLGLRLCEV